MVLASVRAGKHTAMVKYTGPMLGVERESQQEAKLISILFIADNASNLKMHSETEYVTRYPHVHPLCSSTMISWQP